MFDHFVGLALKGLIHIYARCLWHLRVKSYDTYANDPASTGNIN